jgi:uncharacterized protein (UPF0333 family)
MEQYNLKLNLYSKLSSIKNVLLDVRNYMFPIKKITNKFSSINSIEQLQNFIQERSAHVTQTTLYGYIKTRIGSRYAMMFEDKVFSESINIAKWNIYLSSLADCTLYTFSYLMDQKKLKDHDSVKVYFSILDSEKQNGLNENLITSYKNEFQVRIKTIDWKSYHKEKPFVQSGLDLYKWAPIADELKTLDKEIVLNSIMLKWNLVENEFKELTRNLTFN